MSRFRTGLAAWVFLASPLLAADGKECVDLAAARDQDVSSPTGIQVTVTGYNRCAEDVDGRRVWFKVTVFSGGSRIGSQSGHFQTHIASHARGETKVFVECDPERARSLQVEAQ